MKTTPLVSLMIATTALVVGYASAATIDVPDWSFTPDGTTSNAQQRTQISILNDGGSDVLTRTPSNIVYLITTVSFGTGSDVHFRVFFNATGGQNRLGVEVRDDGLVLFCNQGDSGDTVFNFSQNMAGETAVFIMKQTYFDGISELYRGNGTSGDTLGNIWVNPTRSSVEGSGPSAGDLSTVWNSDTYRYVTQEIQNQSTPGTAGDALVTDTVILTGADAAFTNALAVALGPIPPPGTLLYGE